MVVVRVEISGLGGGLRVDSKPASVVGLSCAVSVDSPSTGLSEPLMVQDLLKRNGSPGKES